ncbi:hypothetical protein GCAJKPJK_02882 [Mannheimia haemolytica]
MQQQNKSPEQAGLASGKFTVRRNQDGKWRLDLTLLDFGISSPETTQARCKLLQELPACSSSRSRSFKYCRRERSKSRSSRLRW